jgi:hypothetical protein
MRVAKKVKAAAVVNCMLPANHFEARGFDSRSATCQVTCILIDPEFLRMLS